MRDVIEMARQVKMPYDYVTGEPLYLEKLEAFAALVRADERENFMDAPQEPAPLRDAIVVNLVREGVNKHRARELADHFVGLATAQQQPVAYLCENAVGHKYFRWKKPSSTYKPIALYTSPQQPAVPDALTIADKDSADYHEGWNDCRALMLEMRKP